MKRWRLVVFLLARVLCVVDVKQREDPLSLEQEGFQDISHSFPHYISSFARTADREPKTSSPSAVQSRVSGNTSSMYEPLLGDDMFGHQAKHKRLQHRRLMLRFRQWHNSDTVAKSVLTKTSIQGNPSVNVFLSVMSTPLNNKIPIVLHDSEPLTVISLEQFLSAGLAIPAVILDISDSTVLMAPWLDMFNDACFVHIFLFSSLSVVDSFAEGLPQGVWTPKYILLVNVNISVNAVSLLYHENFNYSPFISLLQPDRRMGHTRYHILTYESFRPHHKVTQRGVYNFSVPQTITTLFPDRFQSFHGYNLRLASWPDDFPYLIPGSTQEETYGLGVNMLNEISSKLSFSYTFHTESEASWGELVNGSWMGMVGQISRGERELCVNVMSIVEDRYKAVDFSVPYFTDSYSFVIRNPLPPPRWWSIVFPFTWETWAAVVGSVAVVSILLSLFLKVSYEARNSSSGAVLTMVGTLLRQNAARLPPTTSFRVFQGTWMLLAMIISISYTGNLVAYITVPAKPHRLSSLRELAASSLTPSMVDYGNFVPGALRISKDPTLNALGQKMELISDYGYDVGFSQVMDGTHAFLEGTEFFQYMVILYHQSANTYFMPETIYPIYVGWIYPKNTPWKHKFDAYLQAFVESGLCRYWKKVLVADFMREMGETLHHDSQQPVRPLSLQDLQGAYIVYGLCLAVALILGILELLCQPQQE